MTGIMDYLEWRGDISFDVAPLNEADCLVLARLSYIPFEDVVAFETSIRLDDAVRALLLRPDVHERLMRTEDYGFLSSLVEEGSVRFREIRLSRYVNHLDPDSDKQFAALTADIGDDVRCVLYRGTDNTIVGWKEDMNMAYMTRIPSQLEAAAYLDAAYVPDKKFILLGHSKGGNLAIYAAAFANPVVQDAVTHIYSFDGPGFHEEVLRSDGYRRITPRVRSFVPQTSVIGMLLDHEEEYTIVHSEQKGLMQHDIYSWQTQRDGFVCLDKVTGASRFVDRTLHDWLSQLEPTQRAAFVDALFQVLGNMQGDSVQEILNNKYHNLHVAVKTLRSMPPDVRKPIMQMLGALLKCVQNNARVMLSNQKVKKDTLTVQG